MSDRLTNFFERPDAFYPVAFRKAMSESLLSPVKLAETPYPKPDPVGALPPNERRTSDQEQEFKDVHHKDIMGIGGTSSGPDSSTQSEEDVKKLVEYAHKRSANETLTKPAQSEKSEAKDDPEWSLFSKKEGEVKTDPNAGSNPFKKEKTTEQGLRYKPEAFNQKYVAREKNDTEGLHQYELNAFYAQTETEFMAGRIKTEDSNLYGLKASTEAKAGFLDWDNNWKNFQDGMGPFEAGLQVKAVEASAKAEGQATYDYKKGEAATSGKLAAGMTLVEAKGSIKQCVVPARIINRSCGSNYLNWAFPDELCKAVEQDDYDWGICLGAEAGASVGLGGSAEGEAKIGKSGAKFGGAIGVQAGPGAKVGIEGEVKRFQRD